MNVEEFLQKSKPSVRKSAVAPFLADVRTLRTAGYSLAQVCEYLASNNVQISVAGLSAYLRRIDSKPPPPHTAQATQPAAPPVVVSAPKPTSTGLSATPLGPPPDDQPRPRFAAPPDPMDAVRWARARIAQKKAASDQTIQGEKREDRSSE